jgi:hypothetical protein
MLNSNLSLLLISWLIGKWKILNKAIEEKEELENNRDAKDNTYYPFNGLVIFFVAAQHNNTFGW